MDPTLRAIAEMLEGVSLGGPENAIGFVMWRITHRFQRAVDNALRHLDLTHLQFTMLALIGRMGSQGTTVTQAELARFGGIHPMQVSKVLKALEDKGMVRRRASATNLLAKSVGLTSGGLAALRDAMPLAQDIQRRMFGEDGRPGGALLEALLRIDRG